ncbi:hypothetical protein [Neisseria polysaccharea]|uniref:hypothetical protein n=1 Tax=Neisseria polysaccharea TaxID=489 RepID=UPI0027E0A930|nr:hypothetical protein [Neisseria polysaccharea]
MKLAALISLSFFVLTACDREVIVVQEKSKAEKQADFEAQQKANCAAVSEKARAKQPYCKKYEQ